MKTRLFYLFFMLSIVSLPQQIIFADERVTNFGNASIKGAYIYTLGVAVPLKEEFDYLRRGTVIEAAKLDALRNAIEIFNCNIGAPCASTSSTITTIGSVKYFKIINIAYLSDTSIEVKIEVPVLSIIINEPRICDSRKYTNLKNSDTSLLFTGLIIDARGLGASKALSPQIFNTQKDMIYGTNVIKKEIVKRNRMGEYTETIEEARKSLRTGCWPICVEAIGVAGVGKSDIIISDDDAKIIEKAIKTYNFLEMCSVVFVL